MQSDKKLQQAKEQAMINELKKRRVALWKAYHKLDDSHPQKEDIKAEAQRLYDWLKHNKHI